MLVRRTRIDDADLSLFEFDYDLTFMVFFLSPDEDIYGRYGGRDAQDPDSLQSLAGLRYAATAALSMHHRGKIVRTARSEPRFIRDLPEARGKGCVHCHEAKEIAYDRLRKAGKWTPELIWRYPLPNRLGLILRVDRGNEIKQVSPNSSAALTGLRAGDIVRSINDVPIHSIADAQYALDGAAVSGQLDVRWRRGKRDFTGKLELSTGWRKADIGWRASMQSVIPSARVYGRDLTREERAARGLSATELAFWQGYPVSSIAKDAGIREGDVILGFDEAQLDLEAYDFLGYVRRNYLVGDRVKVNVIRGRRRLSIPMVLK